MDGLTADTSSPSQVSSFLTVPNDMPQTRSHSLSLNTRSGSASALHLGTDVLRQNIYKNFMRELKTGRPPAEGGQEDWRESSSEETESNSQEVLGCLEQLDLLFEKEKGVVRWAGWLSFKPLLTVHKDRKLELVGRRKWKQFWVTLKGKYAMIAITTAVIKCYSPLCSKDTPWLLKVTSDDQIIIFFL